MNRKIIGIRIVILGAVFLAAIVYFIFFHEFSDPAVNENATVVEMTADESATDKTSTRTGDTAKDVKKIVEIKDVDTSKIEKKETGINDLERIASSFAERFGSFSNQSDYGNVRDLKIFMSARMQGWADDFIEEAIAQGTDSSIYYGITTKTVSAEANSFDDYAGEAEISVKTLRRESSGSSSNSVNFYQDIIIRFVKEKSMWKVDDAEWQGKF